ncbi:MAG: flagellar hook-associated protein 3 [Alkalispirochaeta sp.]
MDRISTNLPNDNMQFFLRERQKLMEQRQNEIASQSRIQNLRDDPLAASHATRYRSYTARLERYGDNIQTVQERNRIAEGRVQEATDLLQRARELAVQGAHGTYAPEDLEHMAGEVEQIIEQMVEIANSRGSDGTTIFAGDRSQQLPFRALRGMRAGGEREMVTEVQYRGTINPQAAEVGENSYIQTNFIGNQVFWAENQRIQSRTDAGDYQVDQNGSFSIDGVDIEVREGDNAFSIIQKINESGAPVRARLDPVHNSMVVESTTPHQVWMQDQPGSTVLQDLGLIGGGDGRAPENIAPSARRSGGSVFDALINLRDQLAAGDQEAIGSRGIQGMDQSLDNMLTTLGRIGAVNSRLEGAYERTEMEIPEVIAQDSRNTDVDLAEAVMELRQLESTHRAALGASARIMQPTLLDFLR